MRKAGGGDAGLKVVFFSSIFSNLLPLFSSPSVLAFFFFFFVSVTSPLVCHFFVITPRSSLFFCFLLVLSSSSFQFVHSSRFVFFFFASVFLFFHSTLRPFLFSSSKSPSPSFFFLVFTSISVPLSNYPQLPSLYSVLLSKILLVLIFLSAKNPPL